VFTQCAKCETVFRLSAEVLRAAGGQVRCGRCGDVFNALARLAENAESFTKGESSLELETRADEILQSIEPVAPVDAAAPTQHAEIARLEVLEPLDGELADELAMEASLEFTLPPGELDRIFIETKSNPLQRLTAEGHRAQRASGDALRAVPAQVPPAQVPPTQVSPTQVPPAQVSPAQVPPSLQAVPTPLPPARVPPAQVPPVARVPLIQAVPVQQAVPRRRVPDAVAHAPRPGLEIAEDVRLEMLASYAYAELPDINPPRRRLPSAAWVTTAVVLALVLAMQVVRSNGDWLATHAPLLGGSSSLAANLSAYQLRQWGVTGDPGAKGTLRVRASIMNAAAQLQPYPLLRLTLANRFGTRVGQREFEPAEYLGKPTAHMLAPGERIDATLDILDPGKDAEGFEIDVCVRRSDRKVVCAGDAPAADAAAAVAAADAAAQAH